MSNGPDQEQPFPPTLTLDSEELVRICQRIHTLLHRRALAARKKAQQLKTPKATETYLGTAKELYAFVYLMNLAGNLGREVALLREVVQTMGDEEGLLSQGFSIFQKEKKPLKN